MRFIEEASKSDDSLPWANEYIQTYGQAEDISRCSKLVWTPKGILVLTELFKGFIFKGSNTYNHLTDAREVWKANPRLPFVLYSQVLENGKIAIAIEESEECIVVFDDKLKLSFKFPKEGDGTEAKTSSNPFIPHSSVPTTSAKRTKDK